MTAILAVIGALGSISTLVLYLFNKFRKTPEEAREELAEAVAKMEQKFKDTGRPGE